MSREEKINLLKGLSSGKSLEELLIGGVIIQKKSGYYTSSGIRIPKRKIDSLKFPVIILPDNNRDDETTESRK